MNMPITIEPTAVISTIPAAVSLAIFAARRCSLVSKSVIDSMAVLSISVTITIKIASQSATHSQRRSWRK